MLSIGMILRGEIMRKQYLHLSAYPCDMCAGPVIAGSLGVRENEISKETDISSLGAICLSCGQRPDKSTEPGQVRYFFPIEWETASVRDDGHVKAAYAEALNRAEPR
jgi:hypothetical protein